MSELPRSDKKTDIPVILPGRTVRTVEVIASRYGSKLQPTVKDLALYFCNKLQVIEQLAPYFKRGYTIEDRAIWFIGHNRVPTYKPLLGDISFGTRVHVRLSNEEKEIVDPLFVAMDAPNSHTVALVVNLGLGYPELVRGFMDSKGATYPDREGVGSNGFLGM